MPSKQERKPKALTTEAAYVSHTELRKHVGVVFFCVTVCILCCYKFRHERYYCNRLLGETNCF